MSIVIFTLTWWCLVVLWLLSWCAEYLFLNSNTVSEYDLSSCCKIIAAVCNYWHWWSYCEVMVSSLPQVCSLVCPVFISNTYEVDIKNAEDRDRKHGS